MSSGTSYPNPAEPAFAPPPSHIAIASTILVHPHHTTRASSIERLEASTDALILLRQVMATFGPINFNVGKAFAFTSAHNISLRQGQSRRTNGPGSSLAKSSDEHYEEPINSSLAKESSLWQRSQDFWHVVGWGLNCSMKYPNRWEYWKIWLDYMLEVLEADWDERSRLDHEKYEAKRIQNPTALPVKISIHDSLLSSYLAGRNSSAQLRRIVKSLFADGSPDAIRLYPEVFDKETRERNMTIGSKRKREYKVNIEEDKYGDYSDTDEDDDHGPMDTSFDASQPESSQSEMQEAVLVEEKIGKQVSQDEAPPVMGGPESVAIRLRLIALVRRSVSLYSSF
jgi:hypothetical protein